MCTKNAIFMIDNTSGGAKMEKIQHTPEKIMNSKKENNNLSAPDHDEKAVNDKDKPNRRNNQKLSNRHGPNKPATASPLRNRDQNSKGKYYQKLHYHEVFEFKGLR